MKSRQNININLPLDKTLTSIYLIFSNLQKKFIFSLYRQTCWSTGVCTMPPDHYSPIWSAYFSSIQEGGTLKFITLHKVILLPLLLYFIQLVLQGVNPGKIYFYGVIFKSLLLWNSILVEVIHNFFMVFGKVDKLNHILQVDSISSAFRFIYFQPPYVSLLNFPPFSKNRLQRWLSRHLRAGLFHATTEPVAGRASVKYRSSFLKFL